jgi:hypothetical protein
MVLQARLANIPSTVKRTARYLRETALRILHRRFSCHPVFSPVGNAAGEIQLATAPPTDLRGRHHPKRLRTWLLALLALLIVVHEARTSALQSWLFS